MGISDMKQGVSEDRYGEDQERRFNEVGHFDVNNGIVAFVDGRGIKRVAPSTKERLNALREAGYSHAQVGVPLSNGERLMDENAARQWQAMLASAHSETVPHS